MSSQQLTFRGILRGHSQWVTSLSVPSQQTTGKNVLASGSRDKTVMIWNVDAVDQAEGLAGFPLMALKKHSEAVSDVVLSSRGEFALSSSWDKTLRLWDLSNKECFRTFKGHTNQVLSVAFSPDNRQIVSSSADKTIKLWNTLGQCKFTVTHGQHDGWISCVRFSPDLNNPLVISCGWDKYTKVWDLKEGSLKADLVGHTNVVNTVTVSPDGSLCASGGKDGVAMLWDVTGGNHLYSLEGGEPINALCFSPCNYWLCAATDTSIKIWCLDTKKLLTEIKLQFDKGSNCAQIVDFFDRKRKEGIMLGDVPNHPPPAHYLPWCTCMTWSPSGDTLYCGATNSLIYVFGLAPQRAV